MGIFWVSLIDLKFDLITYAKAKFAFSESDFNLELTLAYFFKNGPTPASFLFFIFGLSKQTIQFLQQIKVKKRHVHPAYGTGIQTHGLSNMSRLPYSLDQGSHPTTRPGLLHIF